MLSPNRSSIGHEMVIASARGNHHATSAILNLEPLISRVSELAKLCGKLLLERRVWPTILADTACRRIGIGRLRARSHPEQLVHEEACDRLGVRIIERERRRHRATE